jgi:hypothetical protein
MAAIVKKIHLKNDSKKSKEHHGEKEATDQEEIKTPERKQTEFDGHLAGDAEEVPDEEMRNRPTERKKLSTRRIWGARGSSTSSALYEIASTPHKIEKAPETTTAANDSKSKHTVDKETQELLKQMKELSLQMKADLESMKSSKAATSEQMTGQLDNMNEQLQRLTDMAKRHDDEIDDVRGMSDLTHELVLDREIRENKCKMVIKSWPKEATYSDRVRVTNWLLQKANVHETTQQEHGYYTAGRRYQLSPVTILTFHDQDAHHTFEKYAYTSFSAKWPLYYWDVHGNYVQHWKGSWHKLVITNYLRKADLIMNLPLTTALHILTSQQETGLISSTKLTHRTTDKQIFDVEAKKVLAKVTYNKDKGVLAMIVQKEHIDVITEKIGTRHGELCTRIILGILPTTGIHTQSPLQPQEQRMSSRKTIWSDIAPRAPG